VSGELLRLALLGTRDSPPGYRTGTPVDDLLDRRPDDDPERRLLLAAGGLAVLRVGAGLPPRAPSPAAPAPPDVAPVVPPRVEAMLLDMLRGTNPGLLPLALDLVGRRGYRLPPQLLPLAFERCPRDLRPALTAVVGERGRWLAGQAPGWGWVIASAGASPAATAVGELDIEQLRESWELGARAERIAALRRLRASDRAEARTWLSEAWKTEGAADRLAMLTVLGVDCAEDDLPFLEACGGDRSKKVRAEARAQLARIPSSDLAHRMTERAAGVLTLEVTEAPRRRGLRRLLGARGGERTVALQVRPPESLPDDWAADGVVDRTSPFGFGRRADHVFQVLRQVDPARLVSALDTRAETLIGAIAADDLHVLMGLSDGALLHGAQAWVAPLWDRWQEASPEAVEHLPVSGLSSRLIVAMTAGQRASRATRLLERGIATGDGDWAGVLGAWEGPWPDEIGLLWLEGLRGTLSYLASGGTDGRRVLQWRHSLSFAPPRLPGGCWSRAASLPRLGSGTPGARPWNDELDRLVDQINLRRVLEQELRSPAPPPPGE